MKIKNYLLMTLTILLTTHMVKVYADDNNVWFTAVDGDIYGEGVKSYVSETPLGGFGSYVINSMGGVGAPGGYCLSGQDIVTSSGISAISEKGGAAKTLSSNPSYTSKDQWLNSYTFEAPTGAITTPPTDNNFVEGEVYNLKIQEFNELLNKDFYSVVGGSAGQPGAAIVYVNGHGTIKIKNAFRSADPKKTLVLVTQAKIEISKDVGSATGISLTTPLPAMMSMAAAEAPAASFASKSLAASMTAESAAAFVTPTVNPSLPKSCGLDIAFILDISGSISPTELAQMKDAAKGFVEALKVTPTSYSLTSFYASATVVNAFTDDPVLTKNSIGSLTNGPGGGTNWEQGLLKGYNTYDPRTTHPNLVIFATDGHPNHYGSPAISASLDTSTNKAALVANAIKSSGTRILSIGIGSDLNVETLKKISGPKVNQEDVLDSDVVSTDFAGLSAKLGELANDLCGGTVTVSNMLDTDGNLSTTDDLTPLGGWQYNIGGYANQLTDETGKTQAISLNKGSNYSVIQTEKTGYQLKKASCTGAKNNGTFADDRVSGISLEDSNIVLCTFINTKIVTPPSSNTQVDLNILTQDEITVESQYNEHAAKYDIPILINGFLVSRTGVNLNRNLGEVGNVKYPAEAVKYYQYLTSLLKRYEYTHIDKRIYTGLTTEDLIFEYDNTSH